MPRKRRWPSKEEVEEAAKNGILDDRTANIPPYDLEEWEIKGEPEPEERSKAPLQKDALI